LGERQACSFYADHNGGSGCAIRADGRRLA
jgi:hypothetical protein